ncbi:Cytidine deaminase [Quillaja saponaria]|uniref:cytidine deaminase n=1 Tax=Quillaja saponaria TaxID=32244 RepID=A0AAD7PV80_QUISA|nr:Cytidine deaminase [Quillaja saponaria]KAJ7969477.1 Cytidine deaminase [Quillaja saponaria]
MDQQRFVIEASEAESMASDSGLTLIQLLPSLVKSAQSLARPPISNYHVGAIGFGSSGRIFLGVNLEFPGLPLHHSVHAEQFLVTNLSINAEPHLDYLVVSAAPCGHCRQFLQEIRGAQNIKLLITSDGHDKFNTLSHFLSHRFGPDDLLDKEVPLLLEPHHNGLSFLREILILSNGICNGYSSQVDDKLKIEALEAANKSHAPYSGSPSGVALMDNEGKIYKGSYMESAAYNPSLGPVQAALVAYVAGGGGDYHKIVAAALVEKHGALVKQEQTAKLLLQSISPNCEFNAFHCSSASVALDNCKKA